MEALEKLDKESIRTFCSTFNISSTGSKRQLIARIVDAKIDLDEIEGFVEDVMENREREERERLIEMSNQAKQERLEREAQERQDKLERGARAVKQLELQCELERLKANTRESTSSPVSSVPEQKQVKISQYMAPFEMGSDIGLFLTNFERMGQQLEVPEDKWATQLLKLVPNGIATVIARMPASDASDYSKVKESLLNRFKLTAEAFRQRFRKAKREPGQPYAELGYALESNLYEWIKGSKIPETFVDLRELIALEQLYHMIPDNLKFWILDRKPTTLAEACSLADQYEARRETSFDKGRGEGKYNHKGANNKANGNSKPFKVQNNNKNNSSSQPTSDLPAEPPSSETKPSSSKQLHKDLNRTKEVVCFNCNKKGHYAKACTQPKVLAFCMPERYKPAVSGLLAKYMIPIEVNGEEVSCLRDTGCSFDIINERLVSPEQYTGEESCFRQALNTEPCFLPLAKVSLKGKFGVLDTVAAVAKEPAADFIISNQTAERCPEIDSFFTIGAITRSTTRKLQRQLNEEIARQESEDSKKAKIRTSNPVVTPEVHSHDNNNNADKDCGGEASVDEGPPAEIVTDKADEEINTENDANNKVLDLIVFPELKESVVNKLKVSKNEFSELQKNDATLKPLFDLAERGLKAKGSHFKIKEGILTRFWRDKNGFEGDQLVVPTELRHALLEVAHSHSFGAHLGVKKTKARILTEFYYPGIFKEVQNFVKSCPVCQKIGHNKDRTKAPLVRVPLISEPFKRLSVDIVGKLPKTSEGYCYLLTVQCMATRFPDGIPLKNLSSEVVVDGLLQVFSRYGFPTELQTDLGSVFTSQLMRTFSERTGIKQIFSSVAHPESNPVERMHGTLKKILKCLLLEKGKEWVNWLPMAFFALRQMPNESLGFSPAELVYGRQLKGPLSLIREQWRPDSDESENVVDYVLKLLERLATTTEFAKSFQAAARERSKKYYDLKARDREYKVGDSVLILAPSKPNKLSVNWEGPVKVVSKISTVNYIVEGTGSRKKQKIVHVNLTKPFFERVCTVDVVVNKNSGNDLDALVCPLGEGEEQSEGFSEWVDKILTRADLNWQQVQDLRGVIEDNAQVFSLTPGRTSLLTHDLELTDAKPIYIPPYRMNPRVKEIVRKEIELMTELNIIRPSTSEYSSPLILVEAEGRPPRACVDYRKLNAITIRPTSYPMPNVEEKIELVAKKQWITILDLTRGYWQLPLSDYASKVSAFSCFLGSFEPTVLSFGLTGGPTSFQRLMDKVLAGCEDFASAFLDDIAIYSDTWEDHVRHLKIVLQKLRDANLVVKRTKCQFAQRKVLYLGHLVGQGELCPSAAKTDAILRMERPVTKKQIKSFLGMCNYYKRYIPSLSATAASLTDALRKNAPSEVQWTDAMEQAFSYLKGILGSSPVLKAPDYQSPFIVQTDASTRAIGGVLSQRGADNEEHPVLFLSRKLQPRETRYSTVERECLAIIWCVEKLRPYLQYTHFVLETDHSPLQFLQSMSNRNSRLLRWSLALQQYSFTVRHRSGQSNSNADCLSRLTAS